MQALTGKHQSQCSREEQAAAVRVRDGGNTTHRMVQQPDKP